MKKIKPKAIVTAGLPAVIVLIFIDFIMEYLIEKVFGISVMEYFKQFNIGSI